MPNLFIAVATGQNVANLPPILEPGEPGDRVLWAVSPEAGKRGWAEGASSVLREHGFEVLKWAEVKDINNPHAVLHGLEVPMKHNLNAGDGLLVVANGGQKLTPIGLSALLNRSPAQYARLVCSIPPWQSTIRAVEVVCEH